VEGAENRQKKARPLSQKGGLVNDNRTLTVKTPIKTVNFL